MHQINTDLQAGYGSRYSFNDAYSGDGYMSVRKYDPKDFYLTRDSLVVFYQKYTLASGAAGPIIYEIPYETMKGILAIEVENDVSEVKLSLELDPGENDGTPYTDVYFKLIQETEEKIYIGRYVGDGRRIESFDNYDFFRPDSLIGCQVFLLDNSCI